MVEVIEVNATYCNRSQRVETCRRSFDGNLVVFGVVGQGNEAHEPMRFVLEVAKPMEVVDAVAQRFHMAVEHGASTAATHTVPGAMDIEVFLRGFLAAGNCGTHLWSENLGAAARKRIQAGGLKLAKSI